MRKNGVLAQAPVVGGHAPHEVLGVVSYARWGRVTIAPPCFPPCERDCAALQIWALVFGLDDVAPACRSCIFASETALAILSCLPSWASFSCLVGLVQPDSLRAVSVRFLFVFSSP